MYKILLLLLIFLSFPRGASALEEPFFGSCSNPEGTLKVEYKNGTHGVVGDSNTYIGEDKVFHITDSTLLQCFCGEDGKGIQTNWWNIENMNEADMNLLLNQGWEYIPDGALWGLEEESYVARNLKYDCKADNSTKQLGGQLQTSDDSSPSVLGFANTGNTMLLNTLLAFGLLSLVSGLILRKRTHRL